MEATNEPNLDICQLRGLRATYPKQVCVDPYVQMIFSWFENFHDTQMQHALDI